MLVAQARTESLGIVSNDSALGLYDVDVFGEGSLLFPFALSAFSFHL
jgi:hypothetical protein